MSTDVAVKRSTVQEAGTFLGAGLPFVDGDVRRALDITVGKFEGSTIIIQPAKEEIVADEENEIEAVAAVAAVEIIVGEDTKQALLGVIASLPALRATFTETVADMLGEAREGDADYAKLAKSYTGYAVKLETARQAILEFDQENAPGFDLEALVEWSPTEAPEPRTFVVAGVNNRGTRTRARSTVTWSLDEYIPTQRDVEGPEASYHGIRLVKLAAGNWAVESDEGRVVLTIDGEQFSVASSPNKAMRGTLETCGLSPQRSANGFWNGSAQESA